LELGNYVLDRLIGGFNCLFYFHQFNFYIVTDLVVNWVYVLFLSWPGGLN
jgi:hypothetical protein